MMASTIAHVPGSSRTACPCCRLPNHIMAYTRQHQGQTLLVLINFGHSPRSLSAPPLPQGRGQVLLSTGMDRQGELTLAELTLGGNEGLLLELH